MTTILLDGDVAHVAGGDALIGGQAGAVQQIEGLALGHVLVGVDEANAADDAAALQGVRRHAADQTAAADDADFHEISFCRAVRGLRGGRFCRAVPSGLLGARLIARCPGIRRKLPAEYLPEDRRATV